MKSSLIASGLISLASAAAIPKDPMASGPAGPPNPGASLIYVDNAIEKADNRRCEKWGLVKTPRNAFWPVCTTWVLYAAQRPDYTLIAAQITNGECLAWTVLTANNKIIPICDGSVDKTIVNVVEPPAQQQKREVSADRGLLVQENVVKGEDKEPHSPPYASASAEPTPPFASASADASGSATSTASSSSAIGTIPPTELVKLIAPLHKKVEQNEAELRQAKGQLRKLDPSNPLAMGGAEGGEEGKDSGSNKQTPSEDKKETAVTDNETPQESSQKLNDDLHSVHTPKRRYNNTKRQFPPGPAPKFTTTSGQSIASLSQKITELTEELKVARSQLHAYRTTQKHQNEHPMETEEELGYGQGKTMTPVRPKQPQQQEQSAQGHTVIGAEQRGGGGNKKATVEENGAKQGGE